MVQRISIAAEIFVFALLWRASDGLVAGLLGGASAGNLHGLEHLRHYLVAAPLVTLIVFGLLRLRGKRLADVGLERPARGWSWAVAVGVTSAAALFFAWYPADWLLRGLGLTSNPDVFRVDSASSLAGFLISGPLAGGFLEELIYRGYLFSRFEAHFSHPVHPRRAVLGAAAVTSLWFGAEHLYQGWLGAAEATTTGSPSRRSISTATAT